MSFSWFTTVQRKLDSVDSLLMHLICAVSFLCRHISPQTSPRLGVFWNQTKSHWTTQRMQTRKHDKKTLITKTSQQRRKTYQDLSSNWDFHLWHLQVDGPSQLGSPSTVAALQQMPAVAWSQSYSLPTSQDRWWFDDDRCLKKCRVERKH